MRKTNLRNALVAMLLVMGSGTVNSAYYIDGISIINDNSGTVTKATNNPLYIQGEAIIRNSEGAQIVFGENASAMSGLHSEQDTNFVNTTIENGRGSKIVYNDMLNVGHYNYSSIHKLLDVAIKDSTDSELTVGKITVSDDNRNFNAINKITMDGASGIEASVGDIIFNGRDNSITWTRDATETSYNVENVEIEGQNNVIANSTATNIVITGDANTFDNAMLETTVITGSNNKVEEGVVNDARITGDSNTLKGANSSIIVAGSNNTLTDAENSYVSGYDNEITGNNIVAIGNTIKKTTSNSVFIGNESAYNDNANQSAGNGTTNKSSTIGNMTFNNTAGVDTNVGVVSFGKEDQTRVMQGVSAGLVGLHSTDAINGSQLYATNTAIANIGSSMTNIIGGNAHMDSSGNIMVSNVGGTGKDTVDGAIRSNKERIDALESVNTNAREEAKSVGALSAALAGLHPMQYDPKKPSQIMAAVGQYDSKRAVALGVAHYVNEDLLLTTGMSMQGSSHDKNMVNLGVTYKFGKGRDDVRKEYATGPISSIYVMQDKIDALEEMNARFAERTQMLEEMNTRFAERTKSLEEMNARFAERTRELEEKVNMLLANMN